MAETLATLNKKRWDKCKIYNSMAPSFARVAQKLTNPQSKDRYLAVEKATGVPWWFTAVVHERESNQRWDRSLAQGDPWNKKSTHVPKGRGPFKSWEEAAIDALTNCPPYAARNKDWSIGGALAMLERYNGLGYYNKGLPSPYLWAGTNQYSKGKYVADGKYDASHVDKQLGCAGILKFMGVFKPNVIPAVIAGTAASVYTVSFWDHIMNHWFAYGIGVSLVAGLIALMIYAYNEKNNVG